MSAELWPTRFAYTDPNAYMARAEYAAPLEPEGGVLHIGGQDLQSFVDYAALFQGSAKQPGAFMAYAGARGLGKSLPRILLQYAAVLESHPMAMQLGLSMAHDGQPEKCYERDVIAGVYDDDLKQGFAVLAEAGLPVYARIGYEANGPWNGYDTSAFADAFAHVASIARASGAQVATVWCLEGGPMERYLDWAPADDVTDWWSIDLFNTDHIVTSDGFYAEADRRRKPVMIGESTPRRVGVLLGEISWARWYRWYFERIRREPGIKAFSYINWDWVNRREEWSSWGNGRIQDNPMILNAFSKELESPLYLDHIPELVESTAEAK